MSFWRHVPICLWGEMIPILQSGPARKAAIAGLSVLLTLSAPLFLWAPVQASILFMLMALLSLPLARPNRHGWIVFAGILAAVGLYLGWAALGWIWADQPQLIGDRIMKFLIGLPLAFLLFCLPGGAFGGGRSLLSLLVAGYFVAAAFLLADLATGLGISEFYSQWKGEGYVSNMLKPGSSIILILSVMLGFAAWHQQRHRLALLVGLCGVGVLLHPSIMHAAKLALPVALAGAVLIRLAPRSGFLALSLLAGLLLLVMPFVLTPQNLAPLLEAGVPFPPSLLHRLAIWDFARGLVDQAFWAGHGLGSARFFGEGQVATLESLPEIYQTHGVWREYLAGIKPAIMPLHPHNLGLQILLETGMIGAVLFCGLLVTVFKNIEKRLGPAGMRAAFPTLLMIVVMGNFSFSIWQSWWLATQFLLGAFLFLLLDQRTSEKPVIENGG
ncbi:O-antigen ligase family protein [Aestuariispira insulae]|nr:O-antigen ligase family protein [Aestuariispira insulae]